jgi:putative pantetheine hydrolase
MASMSQQSMSQQPGRVCRPGRLNALTDVPGLRVGHAQRIGDGWLSGTTVVLTEPGGAVAAVDVRGGGPGTRETDALDPRNLVQSVEAVVLTGGSAFGLAAADGAVSWLEERQRGFRVGAEPWQVVPVVPAAALFDLGRGGDWRARPRADLGYAAAEAAWAAGESAPIEQGVAGAGTGAATQGGLKGGIGTASAVVPLPDGQEATVAALVALNAAGSPVDPETGLPYGAFAELDAEFAELGPRASRAPLPEPVRRRAAERLAASAHAGGGSAADRPLNTTLAVVATDAELTRAQLQKLAGTAHDGLARAVRPVHLLNDGDTVFTLGTGSGPAPADVMAVNEILAAGADTVTRAIVHALLRAGTVRTPARVFPSYRELYLGDREPLG